MTFTINESSEEDEIDDGKDNLDELADKIRDYLIFADEELNTTQIIASMKDIIPTSKVQKILKIPKYKKSHWMNFKKEGSKNEWLFKARKKYDGCQVVEYKESDFELPECLK